MPEKRFRVSCRSVSDNQPQATTYEQREPTEPAKSSVRLSTRYSMRTGVGGLCGDCVYLGEANVGRVFAICFVHQRDSRVPRLGKFNIDALGFNISFDAVYGGVEAALADHG